MVITLLQLILSIISGIGVGFTLGLIGGGGSILAIPLLIYFVGIDNVHFAIGTTALAVGVNAYINFFAHRRRAKLNLRIGTLFAVIGVIGVLIGSSVGLITNSSSLLILFSLLMVGIGLMMFINRKGESAPEKVDTRQGSVYPKVSLFSMLTGFASGFFGIGGGFLIVPSLMYSAKLEISEAVGTSLLVVGTFGIVAAIRYGIAGHLLYTVSLFYIVGGVLGGIIGTRISTGMEKNRLRKVFSVIVIIVGFYVMARTLFTF